MSNKADKYLKETITEILEEGQWDKELRTRWADNTPAHSKFVTQKVYQYDISKGEFPINTLRTTALKGGLGEILTIYRDQSNKQEDFIRNGVNWWGDWMNEEGNLGTAYAWNLQPICQDRDVIEIEKRPKINTPLPKQNFFENRYTDTKHPLANKEVEGKFCNFRVLDKTNSCPVRYNVQLLDCGEVRNVSYTQIRYKNIKSNFYKSIYNIGFYGNYKKYNWLGDETINQLKMKWTQMFERCYSKNKKLSKWSPEMIDERWNSFEFFVEDCFYIPQFFTAKRDNFKNWVLDKDYYSSNFYSKNTCVFINMSDNELYSENNTVFKYNGLYYLGHKKLSEAICITKPSLKHILSKENLNNKNKEIKDSITINNNDKLYRYELPHNQVNCLLENLENNPFGRRHLLSFFNFEYQDKKRLMECAFETLWSVREERWVKHNESGNESYSMDIIDFSKTPVEHTPVNMRYIDLTLIQRSQDFLTTSSINPAQYTMLLMMVCNHLTFKTRIKHEVGKLLHIVQNCHIYDRHLDAAKEILKRESTGLQPKIELICEPKDFYSHTIEDFKFSGLEGIEKLSNNLEIAI